MRSKVPDLAALWMAVDETTGGALYALRYECETNGWKPHLWSQTPAEGAPDPLTRLFFIGVDAIGKTTYFDTVLVRDPNHLAERIKLSEVTQEAARTAKRIQDGLDRMELGLDPYTISEEVRTMN